MGRGLGGRFGGERSDVKERPGGRPDRVIIDILGPVVKGDQASFWGERGWISEIRFEISEKGAATGRGSPSP